MAEYDYDLLVIGSGPAGQRAAIQGAKIDKRVALVERKAVVGGVCTNTGTTATQDAHIPFDGKRIFVSDQILELDHLPRTLTVVGAGVIGCEYASIFATLGVRVTLIDQRPRLLPFVDAEIVDALSYHMRENRVTLRLGETVS